VAFPTPKSPVVSDAVDGGIHSDPEPEQKPKRSPQAPPRPATA
jgi:cell division protease FtsH